MDVKKMTTKELMKKRDAYRPEALSQIFFIFALISSALFSEALSIIHEFIKENFPLVYSQWAWVVVVLGLVFTAAVIVLAYFVSVRDHSKIFDELERRSAKKKKK